MFTRTFRVHWVDTDVAGVMHFTNHLRYFEACEEEFYRSIGLSLNKIQEKFGIMLPRVEVNCEYKAPCRFDDLIEVKLMVRDVGSKTIKYEFEVFRKGDEKLAARGTMKCIAVDSSWKAVSLPKELANLLSQKVVSGSDQS